MRELIIKRIEEIKEWHGGFRTGWRWGTFYDIPYGDVDPYILTDELLLVFLERIIQQHYKQG